VSPLRRICPKCGAEITGETLGGLCPKCVAALALATDPYPQGTLVVSVPVTEKPGDRIGRYKLLQQIGEGGCGIVYMAEQEEPVRRRVALKVIKLNTTTSTTFWQNLVRTYPGTGCWWVAHPWTTVATSHRGSQVGA